MTPRLVAACLVACAVFGCERRAVTEPPATATAASQDVLPLVPAAASPDPVAHTTPVPNTNSTTSRPVSAYDLDFVD